MTQDLNDFSQTFKIKGKLHINAVMGMQSLLLNFKSCPRFNSLPLTSPYVDRPV